MKRYSRLDDSFDMFLDTITNTFGGVLLITLLIVLMVKQASDTSSSTTAESSSPTIALVDSRIAALEAQKEIMSQSSNAATSILSSFISEEQKSLAAEVAARLKQSQQLTTELLEMNLQLDALNASMDRIKIQSRASQQAIASKQSYLRKLTAQLQKEKAARVRSIPLPKEKRTTKSSEAFFLQNNEIYQLYDTTGAVNRQHFSSCRAGVADFFDGRKHYQVRDGEGIKLNGAVLQEIFQRYEPRRKYLTFVVRPESFAAFANVRSQCVASGFEYRIIATEGLISAGVSSQPKTQ